MVAIDVAGNTSLIQAEECLVRVGRKVFLDFGVLDVLLGMALLTLHRTMLAGEYEARLRVVKPGLIELRDARIPS